MAFVLILFDLGGVVSFFVRFFGCGCRFGICCVGGLLCFCLLIVW